MNHPLDTTSFFEARRSMLFGLAYRLLGSRADAEDAVQDTFVKWQSADHSVIENPASWLTSTCTRRCIDLLRSAHRSRTDYIGTWLPEPLTSPDETLEERASLASSLTTAFLLVLERLTPKERAAYLLHEVFDVSYPEVAATLQLSEVACRKLVSRGKSNVERAQVRHVPSRERQDELMSAFASAVVSGQTDALTSLLSADARLMVDSGGKAPAIRETLEGPTAILAFLSGPLHQYWGPSEWRITTLNGTRGVIIESYGRVTATASFSFDERGDVSHVFIMRNPDKLARVANLR